MSIYSVIETTKVFAIANIEARGFYDVFTTEVAGLIIELRFHVATAALALLAFYSYGKLHDSLAIWWAYSE
jgi:hypothetical protein